MAEKEKNAPAAGGDTGGAPAPIRKKKKSFFKNKWFKRLVILVIVAAAVIGFIAYRNIQAKKAEQADATSKTSVVTRGDIVFKITGSGTAEPLDEYNIVPTVNGEIVAAYYEEGDYVEEGAVLYKFDSTVADNAIKTAENAIKTSQNRVTSALNNVDKAQTDLENRADDVEKAKDNISKLTIYANSTGKVSDLNLTVGNDAAGKICTITDTKTQLVKIPFNASQFAKINVGDSATVSIEKYMTYTSGTVIRKYSAAGTGSDGSVVYDVEIQIDGGVDLPQGTAATATVHTAGGDVISSLAGNVYYPDPTSVNAEKSGKVKAVYVKNGDWVQKGAVIAQLESTDLNDALKTAQQNYKTAQNSLQEAKNSYQNALTNLENAKTTLEDRQSNAEDYTITAPISGVVLSKEYKAGDTVYGQNSTTLMTIADMSKMKFTISVDELDIANIALGQEVEVTSDALEGVELVGYITNISKLGSSQNGVTNYPVEVTIDEPGDLMSGMNVSAEIIVAEANNAIRVSTTAISYFEGKYYATVVGKVEGMTDTSAAQRGGVANEGQAPERNGHGGEAAPGNEAAQPDNAPSADSAPAAMPAASAGSSGGSTSASKERRANREMNIVLSGEEERVEVTVGINDDDYYEILSGLEVGQVVKDEGSSSSGGNFMGMMMGAMGGSMGGGAPGGGGNRGGGGPR
ncbi:MAG: efflux RND transporter periplasmic adaptor subunit [Clostridia bacterium]